MKEDNPGEQVSYMINSRGWFYFKAWIEKQIKELTEHLLSVDLNKIEEIRDIRVKIQTYKQVLKKPEEMISNK